MMVVWTKLGIIKEMFQIIKDRVSSIVAPKDIGRLPLKISSSFAGFTADQWKNWDTYIFCHSPERYTTSGTLDMLDIVCQSMYLTILSNHTPK